MKQDKDAEEELRREVEEFFTVKIEDEEELLKLVDELINRKDND